MRNLLTSTAWWALAAPGSTTAAADTDIPEALRRSPDEPGQRNRAKLSEAIAAKPADKRVVEKTASPAKPKTGIPARDTRTGKKASAAKSGIVAPQGRRSIIPARYKVAYAAHNDTCGTKLALALKAATTKLNDDGRQSLDVNALRAIAKANAIDFGPYEKLNNGQKRMNVGNKLAGLLKAGEKVTVGKQVFANAEKALHKEPVKAEPKAKTPRKVKTPAEAPQPQV